MDKRIDERFRKPRRTKGTPFYVTRNYWAGGVLGGCCFLWFLIELLPSTQKFRTRTLEGCKDSDEYLIRLRQIQAGWSSPGVGSLLQKTRLRETYQNEPESDSVLSKIAASTPDHLSKPSCSSNKVTISKFFSKTSITPTKKPEKVNFNESRDDDFMSPLVIKPRNNLTWKLKPDTTKSKKGTNKKRKPLKNSTLQIVKDNFQDDGANAEHLQMAIALSKSTYEAEYGKQPDDEVDIGDILQNVKPTNLERFGFKSDKVILKSKTKVTNEPSKKSKRFKYITPILQIRTDKERQSLIDSKVSKLLAQQSNINCRHSPNYTLNSCKLQQLAANEPVIFPLDSLYDRNHFYIENLGISKDNQYKCGRLLRDWNLIPGRDKSPVKQARDERRRSVSPDLFESDDECYSKPQTKMENVTETIVANEKVADKNGYFRQRASYYSLDEFEAFALETDNHSATFKEISDNDGTSSVNCHFEALNSDDTACASLDNTPKRNTQNDDLEGTHNNCSPVACIEISDDSDDHFKYSLDDTNQTYFKKNDVEAKIRDIRAANELEDFYSTEFEVKKSCHSPDSSEINQVKGYENDLVQGKLEGICMEPTERSLSDDSFEGCNAAHIIDENMSYSRSSNFEINTLTINSDDLENNYCSMTRNDSPKWQLGYAINEVAKDISGTNNYQLEESYSISNDLIDTPKGTKMRFALHSSEVKCYENDDSVQESLDHDQLATNMEPTDEACCDPTLQFNTSTTNTDDLEYASSLTKCDTPKRLVGSAVKAVRFSLDVDLKVAKCDINSCNDDRVATCIELSDDESFNGSLYNIASPYYDVEEQSFEEDNNTNFNETPSAAAKMQTPSTSSNSAELNITDYVHNILNKDRFSFDNNEISNSQGSTLEDEELNYSSRVATPPNTKNFQIVTASASSANYIVKHNNVTPMPDFDQMSSPAVKQQLEKMGVKPLKRARGVQLLKYIYESTHPLVDDDVDEGKVIKRRKVASDGNAMMESSIEIVGDELIENEKMEELIFERKQLRRVASCQVPLQIVWHNFLSCNPGIRESILLYEPLQLELLHSMIKEEGFKFHIQDLLTFLDRKCITIRIAQKGTRRPK